AAALKEALALEPWVKSALNDAALRPASDGHAFFVGSQSVDVWAATKGAAAARTAEVREKRMLEVGGC
ncbi:hypothetical protein B0A55_10639, partial [Friedmanniomyces simplex]